MTGAAPSVDTLIVGAGHNGLVAGACLAKAGRTVLVLEARETPGGQLSPAEFGSAFAMPLHASARLRPEIVRELDLARHGLVTNDTETPYVAPLADGGLLRLSSAPDDVATRESIRRLSAKDAARWPDFLAFMRAAAAFLD
ncbi:MAG TPA: NAD(P)-binding protein, partial [Steroidobacteraceae bacterium]